MKIGLLILILFIITSCPEKRLEKPFIIYSKCICNDCIYNYTFYDKNGNIGYFDDDITKYSVGDTIK